MMLEGKKIIVTGGASGIGRATCVLAARKRCADVADRRHQPANCAEETAEAVTRAAGR